MNNNLNHNNNVNVSQSIELKYKDKTCNRYNQNNNMMNSIDNNVDSV